MGTYTYWNGCEDRRCEKRYKFRYLAKVKLIDDGCDAMKCITRDISSSGVFFLMNEMVLEGQQASVQIYMSGKGNYPFIKAKGKIVRSEQFGAAMAFEEAKLSARKRDTNKVVVLSDARSLNKKAIAMNQNEEEKNVEES